jgi:hypothetical protein
MQQGVSGWGGGGDMEAGAGAGAGGRGGGPQRGTCLEPFCPGQELAAVGGVVPLAAVDVAQILAEDVACGAAAARDGRLQCRHRPRPGET